MIRKNVLRIHIEELKHSKSSHHKLEAKVVIEEIEAYYLASPYNSGIALCPEAKEFDASIERLFNSLHLGGYYVQFLENSETAELKNSLMEANRNREKK